MIIRNMFLLCLLCASVLLSNSYARNNLIGGYVETGKRISLYDYEGSKVDDEYKFINYNLNYEYGIPKDINFYIKTFLYTRDYIDKNDLDNTSKIVKTRATHYTKDNYIFDYNLTYKEKQYKNRPVDEYTQIKLKNNVKIKSKKDYDIKASIGINSFDYKYASDKNIFNVLGKVDADKYFAKDNIKIGISYKIENSNKKRKFRKQTKQEKSFRIDYTPYEKILYKISSKIEKGQKDTKEEDELDYDYDYDYIKFDIKTFHRISKKFRTDIKYQYIQRDYLDNTLDYKKSLIKNHWIYYILKVEKHNVWIHLSPSYTKVEFPDLKEDNYNKKEIESILNYNFYRLYKTYISFSGNIYKYTDKIKNKDIYSIKFGIERYLLDRSLILLLSYNYRHIEYLYKNDNSQSGMRLEIKYKF